MSYIYEYIAEIYISTASTSTIFGPMKYNMNINWRYRAKDGGCAGS